MKEKKFGNYLYEKYVNGNDCVYSDDLYRMYELYANKKDFKTFTPDDGREVEEDLNKINLNNIKLTNKIKLD